MIPADSSGLLSLPGLRRPPDEVIGGYVVGDKGGLKEAVTFEPLGVVASIAPWNYPYMASASVFAGALLAGNAVLYKPSEFASISGLNIATLLYEAGVPKDAFAVATGGPLTGQAVASLSGLGGIFFTGSYATGAHIATAAAPHLTRLNMELGGKDCAYVREDADVEKAAKAIAAGGFYNAGQSCCSVERVYVASKVC